MCAPCSKLPSNISIMVKALIIYKETQHRETIKHKSEWRPIFKRTVYFDFVIYFEIIVPVMHWILYIRNPVYNVDIDRRSLHRGGIYIYFHLYYERLPSPASSHNLDPDQQTMLWMESAASKVFFFIFLETYILCKWRKKFKINVMWIIFYFRLMTNFKINDMWIIFVFRLLTNFLSLRCIYSCV